MAGATEKRRAGPPKAFELSPGPGPCRSRRLRTPHRAVAPVSLREVAAVRAKQGLMTQEPGHLEAQASGASMADSSTGGWPVRRSHREHDDAQDVITALPALALSLRTTNTNLLPRSDATPTKYWSTRARGALIWDPACEGLRGRTSR